MGFYGFIDRSAEDMTGNRGRERGSDTQQRDLRQESNPGPLQSLGRGTRALPTELNSNPRRNFSGEKEKFPCQKYKENYNLISSNSVEEDTNPG